MDITDQMNRHVRAFATKHKVRLRKAEDGELTLYLGPRTGDNHASYSHPSRKVWTVYYTAPSSNRVAESVAKLATRNVPLDGEGFFEVPERLLLAACALNRWLKPRYRREVAEKARARSDFQGFVQALDTD